MKDFLPFSLIPLLMLSLCIPSIHLWSPFSHVFTLHACLPFIFTTYAFMFAIHVQTPFWSSVCRYRLAFISWLPYFLLLEELPSMLSSVFSSILKSTFSSYIFHVCSYTLLYFFSFILCFIWPFSHWFFIRLFSWYRFNYTHLAPVYAKRTYMQVQRMSSTLHKYQLDNFDDTTSRGKVTAHD